MLNPKTLDRCRLADEAQRVNSQSGVHPRRSCYRRHSFQTDVDDEVPQREIGEPDRQKGVVSDGQRPQQKPRNR